MSGRLCARTGYVTKALTFGLWFHRPFICRATLEFYCVKKSRRRTTAQAKLSFVFNLLLVLFIPRSEWSVQLFSALCIGTDYETGDETDLVLSKTECGGKRFRTKRYLTFLTRVEEFSLTRFLFCRFISDVGSGRSWNIYTLKCLYYLCSAVVTRRKLSEDNISLKLFS